MADSEGTISLEDDASLETAISAVEDCLNKLSQLENEKFIVFRLPAADEVHRLAIWSKYNIQEKVCTEDLTNLLCNLSTEERELPWFRWVRWVLFGVE